MKYGIRRTITGVLAILATLLAVACSDQQAALGDKSGNDAVQMRVYKQPSCGCCGKWVDHVKDAGFAVKTKDRLNLNAIKKEYGIGPRYQSCHTAVVDGYVFEGHIPAPLIARFLSEKPADVIGLAVPGMPIGSPGMEMGERFDSYDVLLLKPDGSSEVYAHVDGPVMTDSAAAAQKRVE